MVSGRDNGLDCGVTEEYHCRVLLYLNILLRTFLGNPILHECYAKSRDERGLIFSFP